MNRVRLILILVAVLGAAFAGWWFLARAGGRVMPVFHAGSLTIPFAQVEAEFERQNPTIDVQREAWGSRTAIRQVTDLGKRADVIGSSDYSIILPMMAPSGYADWYIAFASNKMVIAYTDSSKYADEIDSNNWYQILRRSDVKYGHSDPNQDPAGYRALMVLQLAQRYYHDEAANWGNTPDADAQNLYRDLIGPQGAPKPREVIKPKETDLIPLLQTGEIDYLFIYLSLATQHKLNYILLDEHIDLSNNDYADFYSTASVEVTASGGRTEIVSGKPIIYGVTIPSNAEHPELGIKFIQLLLSEKGRQIFQDNGQPPLPQPFSNDRFKLPQELRELVLLEG